MSKQKIKRIGLSALSLFFAFLFLVTSLPVTNVDAATTVTISRTSATIQQGDTLQLKVYVNGTAATAQWGSSDSSVATVSSSGLVTGKLAGSCIITALVSGQTVDCLISVVKKTTTGTIRYSVLILDTSGSIAGTPLSRQKTAAKRFCKTVLNASGANYIAIVSMNTTATKVCGFSSNYTTLASKIDSISADGYTNMNAAIAMAGKILDGATFTGTNVMKNIVLCSDGLPSTGTKTDTNKYTAADHSLYYKYANTTYTTDVKYKNKGYFVYALGFFHNSTGKDLTFGKQLMKDLASKDKNYIITNTDDIDDAMQDIAITITRTTINRTSATVEVGKTLQLNTYVNGARRSATWKSSNTTIATVNSSGLVTGKKVGTCVITAVCNGVTLKCNLTVKASSVSITLNKTTLTMYKKYTYQLKATVRGTTKTPVWSSSNTAICTVSSNGLVTAKAVGKCTITATVAGKKASCVVTVVDPVKYTQTGTVRNAENNNTIYDARIYVYIGYNNHSGSIYCGTRSDSYGKYKLSLPKGKFTLVTKKDGYITSYQNYEVTGTDTSYSHVIPLTKILSSTQYRIVLTWGSTPRDLDSHLFGPTATSGNRWHVYWSRKSEYNSSKGKYLAQLDVDDRSGYGPETITLDVANKYVSNGTYRYYIYDFTNRNKNPSTALAYSGAKVTVYKGNRQVATYNVPRKAGTIWHVFDIVNGQIVSKNSVAYTNSYERY